MTTTKELIKVNTLSTKLAKQIQYASFSTDPAGDHKTIQADLELGIASVHGWITGATFREVLGNKSPYAAAGRHLWLVRRSSGDYWWFLAPSGGPLFDKHKDVGQLFIS